MSSSYLNTGKDTGCIMDDPARTMAHPIIDFDVETASELVIRSAQYNIVGRGKPLFAIARGSGCSLCHYERVRNYQLGSPELALYKRRGNDPPNGTRVQGL